MTIVDALHLAATLLLTAKRASPMRFSGGYYLFVKKKKLIKMSLEQRIIFFFLCIALGAQSWYRTSIVLSLGSTNNTHVL